MEHDTGVYAICNHRTGQAYIGHSRRLTERWKGHRLALTGGYHHNAALQAAWQHYGEAAFGLVIIERTAEDYSGGQHLFGQYQQAREDRETFWLARARAAGIVLYNDQVSRGRRKAA